MISPKITDPAADILLWSSANTGLASFPNIGTEAGTLDEGGRNGSESDRTGAASHSHEDDFDHTAARVRELVYDSIKRQLVSDVPLCTLLSGGLDSSAITAVASEVYRNEKKEPIRTFSIDYIGNDKYFQASEFQPNADAPWAKKVSEYLGTSIRPALSILRNWRRRFFRGIGS